MASPPPPGVPYQPPMGAPAGAGPGGPAPPPPPPPGAGKPTQRKGRRSLVAPRVGSVWMMLCCTCAHGACRHGRGAWRGWRVGQRVVLVQLLQRERQQAGGATGAALRGLTSPISSCRRRGPPTLTLGCGAPAHLRRPRRRRPSPRTFPLRPCQTSTRPTSRRTPGSRAEPLPSCVFPIGPAHLSACRSRPADRPAKRQAEHTQSAAGQKSARCLRAPCRSRTRGASSRGRQRATTGRRNCRSRSGSRPSVQLQRRKRAAQTWVQAPSSPSARCAAVSGRDEDGVVRHGTRSSVWEALLAERVLHRH